MKNKKMKISPDGSLPRITSSSKGITRHVKIIKIPDDEVKEEGHLYKLVWIGPVESDKESEKSEEELWSDDEIPNVQLPVENVLDIHSSSENKEKAKDVESQTEKQAETERKRTENVHFVKRYNRKFRRGHKQGNYNSSKRNFNTSNRPKNFDKSSTSLSKVDENNYKYFPNNKGSSSNYVRKYNTPRNADSINPWLPTAEIIINGHSTFQPSAFRYPPPPTFVMEPTPPNSNADNSLKKSVGLLGDSPYSASHPHDFIPSRKKDDFMGNQDCWQKEYTDYPRNDYQRLNHGHVTMPVSPGYKNHYQRNHWQHNKKRGNRMNTSGRYRDIEYRN